MLDDADALVLEAAAQLLGRLLQARVDGAVGDQPAPGGVGEAFAEMGERKIVQDAALCTFLNFSSSQRGQLIAT